MRTSHTHPLQIADVPSPIGGRIGLTFCPGKCDPHAMTGAWDRDLDTDLRAIVGWGAEALVTLMESHELAALRVPDLGERVQQHGLLWMHLPIPDVSVPGPSFESAWVEAGAQLRELLSLGGRFVVHCKGGLGRTGLVAARLLVELGEDPREALRRVRSARPGAVETCDQERYVMACVKHEHRLSRG